MKRLKLKLYILLISISALSCQGNIEINDPRFITHTVKPTKQNLKFYLKDKNGINYGNHNTLKLELENNNEKLIFATNGGIYLKNRAPQGLFIENGAIKTPLDTNKTGYGNFYLKPNGVFYITNNNEALICKTKDFKEYDNIKYATQSGPMLVMDDKIHPVFSKESKNSHIRNGVGILPDGSLLFAISKEPITFYDFAHFFKNNNCKNALYLDGFVSRTYLPSKEIEQLDGNFGVIIAETEDL